MVVVLTLQIDCTCGTVPVLKLQNDTSSTFQSVSSSVVVKLQCGSSVVGLVMVQLHCGCVAVALWLCCSWGVVAVYMIAQTSAGYWLEQNANMHNIGSAVTQC